MQVTPTNLSEVLLVEPRSFPDERGYFLETWNRERYAAAGLPDAMVQDNLSWSRRGVLRGLHFQFPLPQGKLVYVLHGEIFDVAADVRVGSPTFGHWTSAVLSLENKRQLYVPEGFAHGFCVLSEAALVAYKCTELYRPQREVGVLWNDPGIGIRWPIENPILSPKDAALLPLAELPADRLPLFAAGRDAAPAGQQPVAGPRAPHFVNQTRARRA